MEQYVNKAAVVAEIKRRTKEHHSGYLVCLKDMLSFLDTLEVKEEPVSEDLEEAATKYARKQVANPDYPTYNDEYELECAFEAGAQWQKEQMIDNACEFLKSYRRDTPDGIGYIAGIVDDETIKDFKKAMDE